ncbi:MAG: hypothetical protein ACMUEL_06025 [Flavobacteriales bacterium Tduv]
MMLFSNWYEFSDVGTKKFVKYFIGCMRFCCFRLEKIRFQIMLIYANFAMK